MKEEVIMCTLHNDIYFNTGNVGVGTTAPSAALDIRGSGLFKSTTNSTTAFQIQDSSGVEALIADTTTDQVTIGKGGLRVKRTDNAATYGTMTYGAGGGVQFAFSGPLQTSKVYSNITSGTALDFNQYGQVMSVSSWSGVNANNIGLSFDQPGLSQSSNYNNKLLSFTGTVNTANALTLRGLHTAITDNSTAIANTLVGLSVDVSAGTNASANRYAGILLGGKVGIGTSAPEENLEVGVAGSAVGRIQATGTHALFQLNDTDEAADARKIAILLDGGILKFRKHSDTNGGQGDILTMERSSGNVGIGTSPTAGKFHVSGSVTSTGALAADIANATTIDYVGTSYGRVYVNGPDTSTNGVLRFVTARSDGSNLLTPMVIDSDGDIGIGTTSTNNKIEINATGAKGIRFYTGDNGYADHAGTIYATADSGAWGQGRITLQGVGAGGALSDTLSVKAEKVGIGTISPGASLHVAAENNNNDGTIKLGTRGWLQHRDGGNTILSLANDYNNNAAKMEFRMKGNTTSDAKMTIVGSGAVGIGVADPGTNAKLEVNGSGLTDYAIFSDYSSATLRIGNDGSGNIRIRTDGAQNLNLYGSTVTLNNTSDKRLKENIKELDADSGLESLLKLRPVNFNWRDKRKKDEEVQTGLIAQELQKIYPKLVKETEDQIIELKNGVDTIIPKVLVVNYEGLIIPIVKSIKDFYSLWFNDHQALEKQKREIAEIKNENKMLKKENEEIKDRLLKLERLIEKKN